MLTIIQSRPCAHTHGRLAYSYSLSILSHPVRMQKFHQVLTSKNQAIGGTFVYQLREIMLEMTVSQPS